MWAVMCVCRHVCHMQAQSCLSTEWSEQIVCLRRQLRTRSERAAAQRDRRQRIHDLVRQLQDHKHLVSLWDSAGVHHTGPKKVASMLRDYWADIMSGGGWT